MLTVLLYVFIIALINAVYYGYYRFTTNLDRQVNQYQNQNKLTELTELRK